MARGRRKKPFKLKLKKATFYTLSSVFLIAVGVVIILSFSRQGPLLSQLFALLSHLLGWGTLFLPFLFIVAGLMLSRLRWQITRPNVFVGASILLVAAIGLTRAGLIGAEIWQNLAVLITGFGAFLVLLGIGFIGFVITFNTSLEEILLFFGKTVTSLQKGTALVRRGIPRPTSIKTKAPITVRGEERVDEEKKKAPPERGTT